MFSTTVAPESIQFHVWSVCLICLEDPVFRVGRRLLGPNGCGAETLRDASRRFAARRRRRPTANGPRSNMKLIAAKTGAKQDGWIIALKLF